MVEKGRKQKKDQFSAAGCCIGWNLSYLDSFSNMSQISFQQPMVSGMAEIPKIIFSNLAYSIQIRAQKSGTGPVSLQRFIKLGIKKKEARKLLPCSLRDVQAVGKFFLFSKNTRAAD
ncbi:unnamed protein product [Victoria cruziana]